MVPVLKLQTMLFNSVSALFKTAMLKRNATTIHLDVPEATTLVSSLLDVIAKGVTSFVTLQRLSLATIHNQNLWLKTLSPSVLSLLLIEEHLVT